MLMGRICKIFCLAACSSPEKYFVTTALPDLYCHLPIMSKSCIYSHYFFPPSEGEMTISISVQIFEIYLYFQFNLLQFNVKLDNGKISIILRF